MKRPFCVLASKGGGGGQNSPLMHVAFSFLNNLALLCFILNLHKYKAFQAKMILLSTTFKYKVAETYIFSVVKF